MPAVEAASGIIGRRYAREIFRQIRVGTKIILPVGRAEIAFRDAPRNPVCRATRIIIRTA
jgi:hypothetical protein